MSIAKAVTCRSKESNRAKGFLLFARASIKVCSNT